jgi:uncharacterized protein
VGLKPWSLNADGVVLTIRLTPRSARDAIGAIEALPEGRTALIARVRAVPSEGEANALLFDCSQGRWVSHLEASF